MKHNTVKIVIALGFLSSVSGNGIANPGCYIQSSTASAVSGNLDHVADIKAYPVQFDRNNRKCVVTFRGAANGRWHNGQGEHIYGSTVTDQQGCDIALHNGKNAMLSRLFGKKITGSEQMICSDFPQPEIKKDVKVGGIYQLSELQAHPSKNQTFVHRHTTCRFFSHTVMDDPLTGFYTWQGVVCTADPKKDQWKVVDLW